MLHITNGDHAAERIREAGVTGTVLPWRDVLHDGPVPAGLPLEELSEVRAAFIGRGGDDLDQVRREFAERDRALAASRDESEVVLWFEHDLYDQLQLIQLLDWFAEHEPRALTLINPPEYLGLTTSVRLAVLFGTRAEVSRGQLALGRRAWEAFRSPDPRAIEEVIRGDTAGLPHLADALRRLLEEYPSAANGLSRTERQALEALLGGTMALRDLYPAAHHQVEPVVWMGDWSFVEIVLALAAAQTPLLAFDDPPPAEESDGYEKTMRCRVSITDAGRQVLAGAADAVRMNGIDRWIGGVHLQGREFPWRWDPQARRIVTT
ncbi:MAG TPA: DUF1835 domain-containing protein [Longimicrobium sp.]|nr:DUF1835 domain-containing protein [Longimicrobium sp.]